MEVFLRKFRLALWGLGCAFAILPFSQAATRVESLDPVRPVLKNKEGKANFDEQMEGASRKDGWGLQLPAGLSKPVLLRLLAPDESPDFAVLVGAKAWPQRKGSYVAIACFSAAKPPKPGPPDPAACENRVDEPQKSVYLGVIEFAGPSGSPRLIARSPGPLDLKTSWAASQLKGPIDVELEDKGTITLAPEQYLKFDLAPFKLQEGNFAFGLRVGWSEGYSGGGAYFEALQLFAVFGDQLKAVFSEPMYFYKNLAGDWNPDGTRQHHIEEGKNVLEVLPQQSAGYHDLQLRSKGGPWKKTFRWSPAQQRYLPAR